MRVGFVGLGSMGLPMCQRLTESGFEVASHDIDAGARSQALRKGVMPAEKLSALAEADVVVTMLPDGDVVRHVLLESNLASQLRSGSVIVDTSSSDPATTLATGEALTRHGVDFVDAPVSGSPAGAGRGELILIVGGEDGPVESAQPILDALGQMHRVGPLGAGHAMKALNNVLAAINLGAAAEAMLVGRRYGLDPELMLDTLNMCTGRNDATENKLGQFVISRSFDSGFRLRLMCKDMAIAVGIARATGSPYDFGELSLRIWAQALEDLGPEADNVEVVRWMELAAGATLAPKGPPDSD